VFYGRPLSGKGAGGPELGGVSPPALARPPAAAAPPARPKPNAPAGTRARSLPRQDDLAAARRLANAGRLEEAEVACRRALVSDPMSGPAHWLLATIAEGRGDLDAARRAWVQALYVRHDDPVATFRLGLLEWRRGRTQAARRRLRAALELVESIAADAWLDEPGGLSTASVRSTIGILLG
jgi:tetratricopeptide (TPR) repeat protein